MKWKVYILYSDAFKKTYVGCSENSEERLKEYNTGHVTSTRKFIPWRIVFEEDAEGYSAVRKRENIIKAGRGEGE